MAAHLLHVFPSFGAGGVPIRMCEMMNRLGPRFRHTVIAIDGVTNARRGLQPSTAAEFLALQIDKRRPVATLLTFAHALRRLRPDLLLTYNWGAVEWGAINRVLGIYPHIHFESGFGPEEADGQIRRRVLVRRVALARAAAVVMPSRTLQRLATEIWRLPASQQRLIPNGVDLARFNGPPEPGVIPGFQKQPGELILGTVSPLRPEKNLGRLLRSFAASRAGADVRLLIVGDGPERRPLEETARQLEIETRVVFAGHVDAPEKVLGWFDLFAISSDTEQMPNALLQAMAASRAVVGVDVGDVKEMVAPENRRFIVPRADEAGLATAIGTVLADQGLRMALGAANRAHVVATYDIDRMVERYRELFENALGAGRPHPRRDAEGGTLTAASDLALPR
jgi:glycosyltransferase involved in cell wall biosynthesis